MLIMTSERISEDLLYPSKFIEVNGSKMHYVEAGQGDPILFLHGIPTSCYLWRNIMPHLATLGRCIAPDLIGFGHSDKPDIEYSVFDHIKYIESFIKTMGLKNLTIIMHGWGSVIGFDYAMRYQNNCKGLVFYEAFLRSLDEDEVSLPLQEQLMVLQDLGRASDSIANGSAFIDKMIPQNVMRKLSEKEMSYYRQPFMQDGATKPILQYLNELPIKGIKSKVNDVITHYSSQLEQSTLPKLLLYSVPGFITTMETVMWAKENLPNLETVDIGEELHLAQESNPHIIGETISVWLQGAELIK
jgi:haloalkane dehalogenase